MTEIHHGLIIKLSLLYTKKLTFKRLRSDRRNSCLSRQLNYFQDRLNDSIEASKQKYYCRMTNKLTNAEKSSKAYWSILKSFLNNKNIHLIPLLFYENCFITNFKGCVHYIFASLFCMSKREHLKNTEKCILFHFESYSCF